MFPYSRLILDIFILLALFIVPWWLAVALIFAGLSIFHNYYEILIFGLVTDALYGVPLADFNGFTFVYTLSAFVLFIIAMYLKRIIKFYSRI
jgi:hypothetical protein